MTAPKARRLPCMKYRKNRCFVMHDHVSAGARVCLRVPREADGAVKLPSGSELDLVRAAACPTMQRMTQRRLLIIVAALVGSLPLGCASAARPPVVAAAAEEAHESPPPFTPDQDVPLVAPDEASAPANARLTKTKSIGGGGDDVVFDRGAPPSQDGFRNPVETPSNAWARSPSTFYPRVFVRGGATQSAPGYRAPGPVPVGGNFPSVPSYGPRAFK